MADKKGNDMQDVKLYYTVIICIAVCLQILMALSISGNIAISDRFRRFFYLVAATTIIAASCEWCGVMLDGADPNLIGLHKVVKLVEFIAAPYVGLFTVCGFKVTNNWKWQLGICLFNTAFQLVSLPFGLVFTVDANNIYHRTDLYLVYVVCYFTCTILMVLEVVIFSRKYQSRNTKFIVGLLIFLILGYIVQFTMSGIRIDYLCAAISIVMFYLYYNNLLIQLDGLTGLLNRTCYESDINVIREEVMVVFFDVDNFKDINDQYGHNFGDECLKSTAKAIYKSYSRFGNCYRIGGDEFCVVLRRNMDHIEQINTVFFRRMENERLEIKELPFVSVGYSTYTPGKKFYQNAVVLADQMMYRIKEEHKAKRQ